MIEFKRIKKKNIHPLLRPMFAHVAIREYAVHSHIYYEYNESIISDEEFDSLCVWLLENFKWIKPHDINDYLDEDRLEEGTGYHLKVAGLTRELAEQRLKMHLADRAAEKPKKKKRKKDLGDLKLDKSLEDLF